LWRKASALRRTLVNLLPHYSCKCGSDACGASQRRQFFKDLPSFRTKTSIHPGR
jgi:hypothetical protein